MANDSSRQNETNSTDECNQFPLAKEEVWTAGAEEEVRFYVKRAFAFLGEKS
jgi:hypothetical protein